MTTSFLNVRSGDHGVTIWPCITGESGFYDVVTDDRTLERVTADEAAAIVFTEVGVPHAMSLATMADRIRAWRADLDAVPVEPVR